MDVLKTRRILYGRAGGMAIGDDLPRNPRKDAERKDLKKFSHRNHRNHRNHEIKNPITYYL
jgi:hypothetical protein